MKHEIISWNTFTLVPNIHCVHFSSIKSCVYREKISCKIFVTHKAKTTPWRIWMKTCWKTRSDNSACANIFLELPLTNRLRHYLEMNATSCYWSYIDFSTLITYDYILTYTYNSDTAAGAEFISSRRSCS